jgi:hypothetical protein
MRNIELSMQQHQWVNPTQLPPPHRRRLYAGTWCLGTHNLRLACRATLSTVANVRMCKGEPAEQKTGSLPINIATPRMLDVDTERATSGWVPRPPDALLPGTRAWTADTTATQTGGANKPAPLMDNVPCVWFEEVMPNGTSVAVLDVPLTHWGVVSRMVEQLHLLAEPQIATKDAAGTCGVLHAAAVTGDVRDLHWLPLELDRTPLDDCRVHWLAPASPASLPPATSQAYTTLLIAELEGINQPGAATANPTHAHHTRKVCVPPVVSAYTHTVVQRALTQLSRATTSATTDCAMQCRGDPGDSGDPDALNTLDSRSVLGRDQDMVVTYKQPFPTNPFTHRSSTAGDAARVSGGTMENSMSPLEDDPQAMAMFETTLNDFANLCMQAGPPPSEHNMDTDSIG